MMKPDEHRAAYLRLMRKIDRYTEARRIAEETLDKLKGSPDWAEFCKVNDMHPHVDFGDLTC